MHFAKISPSVSFILFIIILVLTICGCVSFEVDPIAIQSCLSNPPNVDEWIVVNSLPNPTYLDDYDYYYIDENGLKEAIRNKHRYIYISEGTHSISHIEIKDQPIVIIGASKEKTILQLDGPGSPLFWIQSKDVIICNLSMDTHSVNADYVEQEGSDDLLGYIAPAVGCFHCESVILRNLNIIGSHFASVLQFSSIETVDYNYAYKHKQYLGYDNVIEFVTISLYGEGLAATIAFDLQVRGRISNNTITSAYTGVAIYLSDDIDCTFNSFVNTVSTAISMTLPSQNIQIGNNQILYTGHYGIRIIPPEHQPSNTYSTPDNYQAEQIIIQKNLLQRMRNVGIEVTKTIESTIIDNTIYDVSKCGIYLSDSKGTLIQNNYITLSPNEHTEVQGIHGTYLVIDSSIVKNSILSLGKSNIQTSAIRINQDTSNTSNMVSMNLVSGKLFEEQGINVPTDVNFVENNICDIPM